MGYPNFPFLRKCRRLLLGVVQLQGQGTVHDALCLVRPLRAPCVAAAAVEMEENRLDRGRNVKSMARLEIGSRDMAD